MNKNPGILSGFLSYRLLAVSLYAGHTFLVQPERLITKKLIRINMRAIKIRRLNIEMKETEDTNKFRNNVLGNFELQ